MECPRCGFEQPPSNECASCGIIFSKYLGGDAGMDPASLYQVDDVPGPADGGGGWGPPGDAAATGVVGWYGNESVSPDPAAAFTPGPAPPFGRTDAADPHAGGGAGAPAYTPTGPGGDYASEHDQRDGGRPSPWEPNATQADGGSRRQPTARHRQPRDAVPASGGAAIRGLRGLFALLGVAAVLLMILNGQALGSIFTFLALAFYTVAFIWCVTTIKNEVGRQQLAVEGGLMAAVTAAVLVLQPALLSPSTRPAPSRETAAPANVARVLPDTALGAFVGVSLDYLEGVGNLVAIDGSAGYEAWDVIDSKIARFDEVKAQHVVLGDDDRARAFSIWSKLKELAPIVTSEISKFKSPAPHGENGYAFNVPAAAHDTLGRLYKEALEAAESLRSATEIYQQR